VIITPQANRKINAWSVPT